MYHRKSSYWYVRFRQIFSRVPGDGRPRIVGCFSLTTGVRVRRFWLRLWIVSVATNKCIAEPDALFLCSS